MYAPGNPSNGGFLSRGGPATAVIGIHILIIYGLAASMGVVKVPQFTAPLEAVFIPEQTQTEPDPPVPVKPEIDQVMPTETPMPEVQFDEPVVAPVENTAPPSENAIAATTAGAVAQDLKTSNRVEPTYPPAARRAGEEGTVRLKVLVDERGRPKDVAVATSSGFARLDQAAMDAVRKWRFVAATDGTNPISAWTQVAVTFRLTNA
jgi:protein TonB